MSARRIGTLRASDHRLDRLIDDDDRPPICPACGVTMVPAALSARETPAGPWICLECEESGELD